MSSLKFAFAALNWLVVVSCAAAQTFEPSSDSAFLAPSIPQWTRRPPVEQSVDSYPLDAFRNKQPGEAIVRCRARTDGALESCAVAYERPAGAGFGAALLRLAKGFAVSPSSAIARGRQNVLLPFRWEVPDGSPLATLPWSRPR